MQVIPILAANSFTNEIMNEISYLCEIPLLTWSTLKWKVLYIHKCMSEGAEATFLMFATLSKPTQLNKKRCQGLTRLFCEHLLKHSHF